MSDRFQTFGLLFRHPDSSDPLFLFWPAVVCCQSILAGASGATPVHAGDVGVFYPDRRVYADAILWRKREDLLVETAAVWRNPILSLCQSQPLCRRHGVAPAYAFGHEFKPLPQHGPAYV